ncbi:scarecrow-like protein 33 [Silene latifolia]|uniref:scarecrow-like protein 33 n=1 Tax=Silene latifolia TaxID=37657 RepID=UPI003D77EF0A
MGSQFGEFSEDSVNGKQSGNRAMYPGNGYDESLNYANLFNYKDQSQDLSSLNLPSPLPDPTQYNMGTFSRASPGVEFSDDSDDSDDVLKYIREMLMEEDMEEKPCMFHDPLALQVAERPFYDALGTKYPHSPNQHPLSDDHFVDSPDDPSWNSASGLTGASFSSGLVNAVEPVTPVESNESEGYRPWFGQITPVESSSQPVALSQSMSSFGLPMGMNIFSEQESIMQFQKGMEEASKFLPKNNNIVIDLENFNFPDETKQATTAVVKKEKVHSREGDEFDEGRSSKQSAVSTEEAELCDLFDKVLLCAPMTHEAHCTMGLDSEKGPLPQPDPSLKQKGGKDRSRKQDNGKKSKNTVDLRSLLILCAQSTASDDRRTSDELLKQIRDNSSPDGDGSQRLAHYVANALEARLAGTGSQIYTALSSKRTSAADMIKAYQFFIRTCPFKKIFIGFANHTIIKAAENKSKLHIIDFGILYGFHWPLLIQRLSERPGGPPKLCITGIELPQPGFRPAERVETTGRRLAKYCERFKVPFEYHAIAQKWETIKLEDLKIDNEGIIAVNCLFRFKNLLDETIVVDSPRNAVLNLVRRINPDIFVHGVINGSYNAPFFVSRFREAVFHYSTLFDMFDTNACRDDPERFMFEKEFYGREIMNVVACEGTERVERPETYKQWQVRNSRAGFKQLRLDPELMGKLKCKVKGSYHKDFVIDVDGQWALLGWKGRICYAISAWVPA